MSTIPSSSAFDVKYCSLCDAYFYSEEMLKAHLQSSNRHPKCTTCDRSFINGNARRNHYVLSPKHNFCRICEKHFKTAAGLRIHIEFSHLDSDTEDGPSTRPDGWEDQLGLEEEAALNGEIPIPQEDIAAEAISGLAARVAVLNLRKSAKSTGVLRPRCPICLSGRKKMCATRCGHVFCSACITHVLNDTKSCPSCRQPALTSQLRTLDLRVFGSAH
ncbi:hypothetical protein B0H19DRAFT_1163387 [Mycena capillaripes]|nr:hypothetical protein B0H19DRAFT_1163387 [Mycena capillaripes]